ncbi:putative carbohydrate esterase At4g34215 [Apium graveolens]|uniref:putative carbohydrate esterase At4g34215 n=1 Tax=Apium graveolens TaxID=4045 RepID=UPI003D7A6522
MSMDTSNTTPTSTQPPPPPKQIFILSGQSNMAGRGGVTNKHWNNIIPPQCTPHPSIHRFTADLKWVPAKDPLHADIDTKKTCGVGPGMPFANAVKDVVGEVGLVPCAVGGTAIKEWARGCHLYENMIKRAKASVENDQEEIRAVLWYQGESDTSSKQCVEAYRGNMEMLTDNVRLDLGLPHLPIIQVAIASGDKKYLEEIREIQKAIDVQNVVCVDAKGLELKEDKLHLTTEACVELGQMLAHAYLTHFHSK